MMFINIPINSPAPDHLFLLRNTQEVIDFFEKLELKIEAHVFAPQTNFTMAKAEKFNLTISCGLIVTHR